MKGIASTGAPKTLLGGWMGGRMEGKAGLRIAYSNQKSGRIFTMSERVKIDINKFFEVDLRLIYHLYLQKVYI
jgi:hypothetical protein